MLWEYYALPRKIMFNPANTIYFQGKYYSAMGILEYYILPMMNTLYYREEYFLVSGNFMHAKVKTI